MKSLLGTLYFTEKRIVPFQSNKKRIFRQKVWLNSWGIGLQLSFGWHLTMNRAYAVTSWHSYIILHIAQDDTIIWINWFRFIKYAGEQYGHWVGVQRDYGADNAPCSAYDSLVIWLVCWTTGFIFDLMCQAIIMNNMACSCWEDGFGCLPISNLFLFQLG